MKKYRMINLSTKEEIVIEAETISVACAKLGWVPTMTETQIVQDKTNSTK